MPLLKKKKVLTKQSHTTYWYYYRWLAAIRACYSDRHYLKTNSYFIHTCYSGPLQRPEYYSEARMTFPPFDLLSAIQFPSGPLSVIWIYQHIFLHASEFRQSTNWEKLIGATIKNSLTRKWLTNQKILWRILKAPPANPQT